MRKRLLAGFVLCASLSAVAQDPWAELTKAVSQVTSEVEKTYHTYSSNIDSWSRTAYHDMDNYVTASGKIFQEFARQTESHMNATAKQLVSDLQYAQNQLASLTNLKCSSYIQPVTAVIDDIKTPLDSYNPEDAACRTCIKVAVERFMCSVPEIFEGNISLVKRFDEAMKEADVQRVDAAYRPAAAMVKLVYSDFAESLVFVMSTMEQMQAKANISTSPEQLKVLYSPSACGLYGTEAMGILLGKLNSENPKTRMQRLVSKLLTILDRMDAANTWVGRADRFASLVSSQSTQMPIMDVLYENAWIGNGGWNTDFSTVMASNNGFVYGIKPNGDFHGYEHMVADKPVWEGGNKIGAGWNIYTKVFAGTDRTIYAIDREGVLWWYKNNTLSTDGWQGRIKIGTGWHGFKDVKAGSNGMIYALRTNGEMLWYQNTSEGQGEAWHPNSGRVIGTGWNDQRVKFLCVGQDGVIFRVDQDGNLYWYLNTKHGAAEWSNNGLGLLIDSGWNKYVNVFGGKDNVLYGVTSSGELYRHQF